MKRNENFNIEGCGECPDCQINYDKGYICKKFSIEAPSHIKLFEKCRLPEIKEIKIWFEKRPPEAQVFDLCVYKIFDDGWSIDIMLNSRWMGIYTDIFKETAEAFLGCKIPDEVKP